jgi:hypothetical protein
MTVQLDMDEDALARTLVDASGAIISTTGRIATSKAAARPHTWRPVPGTTIRLEVTSSTDNDMDGGRYAVFVMDGRPFHGSSVDNPIVVTSPGQTFEIDDAGHPLTGFDLDDYDGMNLLAFFLKNNNMDFFSYLVHHPKPNEIYNAQQER